MLKIALTGGIGSGKTEVTKYFRRLGVTVLDADEISHELTSENKFILGRIADTFGKSVMNLDNSLSRKNLRELIFSDKAAKRNLAAQKKVAELEKKKADKAVKKGLYE